MQQFIAHYGYLAIFLLMLAESACIPVPSELTMLFGGALAAGAVAGTQLNLATVIVAGVAGNVAGSYIAWAIGRYGGQSAWRRWGRYILLREHDIDRAELWFDRHGTKAVFFARLLPVVRTFISLPAGFAKMPPTRFGLYTLAGCIPWTLGLGWAGYTVGSDWQRIADGFHGPTYVIAAIVVAGVVIGVALGLHRRRREPRDASDPTRGNAATPRRAGVPAEVAARSVGLDRDGSEIAVTPSPRRKAVAGIGLFAALLALAALTRNSSVTAQDLALDQAAVAWRAPTATSIFLDLTAAAQEAVGLGALAVGVVVLWLRQRRWDATRLLLMAGGAWLLALLVKHLVNRPRPPARLWLLTPDATGSFPSGHDTTATVLVVIIAAIFIGSGALRAVLTAATVLFAVAVGASRVYLGDHYPTDVLGSYLTVAAAVLLVAAVTDLPAIQALGGRLHLRTPDRLPPLAAVEEPATAKLTPHPLRRRHLPPVPPPRPPRPRL